jgi:nucleotide-binding universal stress UspA family protein
MQTASMDLATVALSLPGYGQEACTMLNRILVPLDGSTLASWVIPWADELAGALDAVVELVNVVTPAIEAGHLSTKLSSQDGGLAAESAMVADAAARFQYAARVEWTTLRGSPGRRIAEHARATRPDLILMTSQGRYGLQRALLGSVASAVIREVGTPVWVIRGDLAAGPPSLPRRVLVPLQGIARTPGELFAVLPLAQRLSWTLTLFAAVPFPRPGRPELACFVPVDMSAEDEVLDARTYLHRVARWLRAHGVAADVLVRVGGSVQEIVKVAHTYGVDLIAMSTVGTQGVDPLTTNGAFDTVLAEADRPVLVLPMPTAALQAALSTLLIEHTLATPIDAVSRVVMGIEHNPALYGHMEHGVGSAPTTVGGAEPRGHSSVS